MLSLVYAIIAEYLTANRGFRRDILSLYKIFN